MLTQSKCRFIQVTFWMAWLFCVLIAAAASAQPQANSQVLNFTGSIPSQPDGPVDVRLRLYDANAGGTRLFEETQTVAVVSQTFTVRIGDATTGGVPATLFRDNPSLWIAFALESAPDMEIGARTAITSGGYAHAAALLTSPTVRTVNGLVGDVTLAPGSNVTITPSGSTLTIDATTGLANVAHDATLLGTGTSGSPLGVAAPLQLTSSSGGVVFAATNNGSGAGVQGTANGPQGSGVWGISGSGFGVRGDTGTGYAVIGSSGGGGFGVYGTTNGGSTVAGVKGEAIAANGVGVFGVSAGTGGTGVWGSSSATGFAVYGSNSGGGFAGFFNGKVQVNGALTASSATFNGPLTVTTPQPSMINGNVGIGTTPASSVKLQVNDGTVGTAVLGASAALNGIGLRGEANNGDLAVGVYGNSNIGYAGLFNGRVSVQGHLELPSLGTAGSQPLCRNNVNAGEVASCSSSLRYKTDIKPFSRGLDVVNRLRPIAFTWKDGGVPDVGLAAEEVEQVEPRLTFRNEKGEIEGVKYNQLSAVFVNAITEQQTQIRQQQEQIAVQQHELSALKVLVCELRPEADGCR